MKRLTRREKRQIEHGDLEIGTVLKDKIFKVKTIEPLTTNQSHTFEAWNKGKNLLLTGTAGTGKSFVACYLALTAVFAKPDVYDNVTIVRSTVPSRDQGFLKGSIQEKSEIYEMPYISIFQDMSDVENAYASLKGKGLINFISTSYIRGMNLKNTIFVVDEIQNMTGEELHTITTRVGKNSRVIMCGDIRQNDLKNNRQTSGFNDFSKVVDSMKSFRHIRFDRDDIVRSGFVREYIIARENLEDQGLISSQC